MSVFTGREPSVAQPGRPAPAMVNRMPNEDATCPSADELRGLLVGSLSSPRAVEMVRHIDDCQACQQHLDRLEYLGRLSPAEVPFDAPSNFGPAFYRALDTLQKSQRTGSEAPNTPLLARLLEPSADARYLGRLGYYEVISLLGHGGMGIVFRAHDPVLNREVAVKILAPHMAHQPTARERFAREARAAAAISNDNVLSIYAVSESAGLPYLVMPYVVGRSLAEMLARTDRLPLSDVLRIGMQTALGLAAAHQQGVVHRDIKPSNLLLEGADERVKIADFGLAAVLDGSQLTHSGALVGTPEFMAPEQAREDGVDARCDLFSLGSVLYLMATGRSPFQAATPLATIRRVCDDMPPPITQFNSDATAWLAAVVERLLQKNPADRYQTAAEVAESLRHQFDEVHRPRRPAPPARVAPALPEAASPPLARSKCRSPLPRCRRRASLSMPRRPPDCGVPRCAGISYGAAWPRFRWPG